ncbi:MAG: CPXCG motif-containing cysteine-rich protein [Shewanella sp.]|nr:CPXCG motif-containing cysteine-rich protein [Shewanella sp.]MCF1430361.1 CPXCG motif-containing cysteine-rich protein [Shewanella sp.]MCF1439673.1 CPXCG motif-containing cysteine-rich protein [Shewanella sp.]MCF1459336.1 CPXCG motif-containing cysteine-rich protein [Shewanella sp.]
MKLKSNTIHCPHCGHHQHIDIDSNYGDQEYVENCRVCCNPIHLRLHIDEQHKKVELYVDADDEQYY